MAYREIIIPPPPPPPPPPPFAGYDTTGSNLYEYTLFLIMSVTLNKPVYQMQAPLGGLSRSSGKLWQDYSSCYMFLNIKRNIF